MTSYSAPLGQGGATRSAGPRTPTPRLKLTQRKYRKEAPASASQRAACCSCGGRGRTVLASQRVYSECAADMPCCCCGPAYSLEAVFDVCLSSLPGLRTATALHTQLRVRTQHTAAAAEKKKNFLRARPPPHAPPLPHYITRSPGIVLFPG